MNGLFHSRCITNRASSGTARSDQAWSCPDRMN